MRIRSILIPLAAVLCTAAATQAQSRIAGDFELERGRDGRYHINFKQDRTGRGNWAMGRTFESGEIDIRTSGNSVTFELHREAGVIRGTGRGDREDAYGDFTFEPAAGYRQAMSRLGFNDMDVQDQFSLAIDDLTTAEASELREMVSDRLNTTQLIRMVHHGAGHSYVRTMTQLGFRNLDSDEYVRSRDHGVTASYVREMRDAGFRLGLDELITTRDHGVTPEYISGMRALGFDGSHSEMVRARDHGVTPDYVRGLQRAGFTDLSLAEYTKMRDHGVTADYAEDIAREGYKGLSASQIVRLRDHGVSASYIRRVKSRLREEPSLDEIIRLRSRGF